MRASLLMPALILTLGFSLCGRLKRDTSRAGSAAFTSSSLSLTTGTKPDFDTQIKPIFQTRCQPCHFQGGQVYQKLPFDRPETIKRLGAKLFTRIKDEKEKQLIRDFLAEP